MFNIYSMNMEIKEFIEKFAEAIDVEDVESLKETTEFKILDEWSSLAALSVIAMIDEEYNVVIKGDDIRRLDTIKDLFDCVISSDKL